MFLFVYLVNSKTNNLQNNLLTKLISHKHEIATSIYVADELILTVENVFLFFACQNKTCFSAELSKKFLAMGKKDKSKKGKGAEKTIAKTLKKQSSKLKKELAAKGEVSCPC